MFLSMQIVAVTHHKQKNSNLSKVGTQKWIGGGPFVEYSKIVLKFFKHNKNSSNAIAG